ncbi:MAG: recombinase family protein, partial [Planctomycetota bacterium]
GEAGIRSSQKPYIQAQPTVVTEVQNCDEVSGSDSSPTVPVVSRSFASSLAQFQHNLPNGKALPHAAKPSDSSTVFHNAKRALQVVIYTRYTTVMQREESCADQERKVREYLDKIGIDHSLAVVIADQKRKGTRDDRLGFLKLMDMVKRGKVDLVISDEQSRLTRSLGAAALIQDLTYADVRFIGVKENIDTANTGWEILVQIMGMHNNMAVRETGHRVFRGQEGRVLDGYGSAGDFCFGYKSIYIDPNWAQMLEERKRPKKEVVINEVEAPTVLRIFNLFVQGHSVNSIARELNRLGVDKGHRSTAPGWHPQQVHRALENEKYIGVWTWGATMTKSDSHGRKQQIPVGATRKVIRVERPLLRIVTQELWDTAQARLKILHAKYGQKPGQARRGPASHYTELYPQRLLSGLLHCGKCGARMTLQCGKPRYYFGCPNHWKGTCDMAYRAPEAVAEHALLTHLGNILTAFPDWMKVVYEAMEKAIGDDSNKMPTEILADQRRLEEAKKKSANLLTAVENGGGQIQVLTQRLADVQTEIVALEGSIAARENRKRAPATLPSADWLQAELSNLPKLLNEGMPQSALLLRKIVERVTVHSIIPPGKKKGWGELEFRINTWNILAEVLGDKLPQSYLPTHPEMERVFRVPLGGPTRMDRWAPEIISMRQKGMTWKEIGHVTGLKPANAHVAYKRLLAASEANG